jgi:hypothetical protein
MTNVVIRTRKLLYVCATNSPEVSKDWNRFRMRMMRIFGAKTSTGSQESLESLIEGASQSETHDD